MYADRMLSPLTALLKRPLPLVCAAVLLSIVLAAFASIALLVDRPGEVVVVSDGDFEPPPETLPSSGLRMATPMQVKRSLEQALLDAHVSFLYGCIATDVLRDEAGKIAGIVIANRDGR
jgi:ABC-type amino acid transport substrate-binding protein